MPREKKLTLLEGMIECERCMLSLMAMKPDLTLFKIAHCVAQYPPPTNVRMHEHLQAWERLAKEGKPLPYEI